MVIENPPMARKGHNHVCIGLGCFLLVFPFFSFLFLEILFNVMCAAGAVATVVVV